MENIKELDSKLYKVLYIKKDIREYSELWCKIKNNPKILEQAIEVVKNKQETEDTLLGTTIANSMLFNYQDVNNNIYQKLINIIYSNPNIARTVVDGYANGGYSFLLISLWNNDLKLSEEQKQFAVKEAMHKLDTTEWYKKANEYSSQLEQEGITDKKTTYVDIETTRVCIGQKTYKELMHYWISSLGNEQAHGVGVYDIRYCILRNSNWSKEEKQKLIMDFWYTDEIYSRNLEAWEWGVINDFSNFQGEYNINLLKDELYNYTYQELYALYNKKEITDKIWSEINFCREMHELRKPIWKIETKKRILQK